jgi:MFS family permease
MVFVSNSAILPLFVSHYTSEKWVIGLIPALFVLGLQGPQVFGAAYRARVREFWRGFKVLTLVPRLALVALALTPLLPPPFTLPGFFLLFLVYWGAIGFQAPVWFEFVGHLIPPDKRGRFFGIRFTIGGVASIAAQALAGILLAKLAFPGNFTALFALAAVFVFLGYLCLISVRFDWEEVDRKNRQTGPFWTSAFDMVKSNHAFRGFVVARILMTGGVMAMSFYVIDVGERFGMSEAAASQLAIALLHVPALTGALWGGLADRIGSKPVVLIGTALGAAGSAVLLAAPNLAVYVAGLGAIGCANLILMILDGKWLMQIAPDRTGTVTSFFSLAIAPWSVGLPVVAGLLAARFGMGSLFWATALAWLAGGAFLALAVPEPGTGPRLVVGGDELGDDDARGVISRGRSA